jgi:hypothetical protein
MSATRSFRILTCFAFCFTFPPSYYCSHYIELTLLSCSGSHWWTSILSPLLASSASSTYPLPKMPKAKSAEEKMRFAEQNGYTDDINKVNGDPVSREVEEYTDERQQVVLDLWYK